MHIVEKNAFYTDSKIVCLVSIVQRPPLLVFNIPLDGSDNLVLFYLRQDVGPRISTSFDVQHIGSYVSM